MEGQKRAAALIVNEFNDFSETNQQVPIFLSTLANALEFEFSPSLLSLKLVSPSLL